MKKNFLSLTVLFATLFLVQILRGGDDSENLMPGDTSFEASVGYFTQGWFGQGGAQELVVAEDAPFGRQYARGVAKAGELTSYSGDKIRLDSDRDYTFSCYVKADKPMDARLITVQCDWKDTQMHNFKVTDKWERIAVTFRPKCSSEYRLVLTFDNEKGTEIREFCFDAVQMEYGKVATAYHPAKILLVASRIPSAYDKVFFVGETPELDVSAVDGRDEAPGAVSWKLSVSDYRQNAVLEKQGVAKWQGGVYAEKIPLPSEKKGLYTVRVVWSDEAGKTLFSLLDSYAVIERPLPRDPEVRPYLGVNSGLNNGVARLGVRWAEIGFWWKTLMPTDGEPDYEAILKMIRNAKAKGLNVKLALIHLPATPNWAHRPEEVAEAKAWGLPETFAMFATDEAMAKLEVAFEELIRRAGNQIDLLEVGGEDELISGSEPYYRKKYPESIKHYGIVYGPVCTDLAKLNDLYIRAARRGNPNLLITCGRTSGGGEQTADFPFSREIFDQMHETFAYYPMDCYSFRMRYLDPANMPNVGSPNREFQSVFRNANEMIRKHSKATAPYVAEYGFAIDNKLDPDHPLQQEEANRMISAVLTARLLGAPFFFWFNTYGCVEGGCYDYGLWHGNVPMLLIPTISQVARVVEGVRQYDSNLGSEKGNLKLGLFGQKDKAYLAIWTDHADNPVTLDIPEGARLEDCLGNDVPLPADGTLTAGILAQYVVLDGSDAYERLHRTLETAQDGLITLDCQLRLEIGDEASLSVISNSKDEMCGATCVYSFDGGEEKTLSYKAGQGYPWTSRIKIPRGASQMSVALRDDRGHSKRINLDLVAVQLPLGRTLVAEFGKSRKGIFPPDPHIRWDGEKDLGGKIFIEIDDENVTLEAQVTDDLHFNTKAGDQIWNGDCFQVAFTPNAVVEQKPETKYFTKDEVEVVLAKTSEGDTLLNVTKNCTPREYSVVRDDAAGVTTYRLVFSRRELHLSEKDKPFRMACVVFDDDDGNGQAYYYQTSPGITGAKNTGLFTLYRLP